MVLFWGVMGVPGGAQAAQGGSIPAVPTLQSVNQAVVAQSIHYAEMGAFEKFILTLSLLIGGMILLMIVMALIAWVTGILESLEPPQSELSQAVDSAREREAAPQGQAQAETVQPRAAAASPIASVAQGAAPPSQEEPPRLAAPSPAPNTAYGSLVDATTVAVVTAAITVALDGRRFRIQRIKMASGTPSTSWGQIGRQSIHASHALERKFK